MAKLHLTLALAVALLSLPACDDEVPPAADASPDGEADVDSGPDADADDAEADADVDSDRDAEADLDADLEVEADAEPDADQEVELPPRVPWGVAGSAVRVETGEALLLRGINLSQVSKDLPDHLYPLDEADVELLRRRGFNSVRMLTFWDAMMPTGPDEVDLDYVEAFAAQVELLAAGGLYVVIDMHQDLYGEPFSNGAPEWSCPEEIRAGYEPTTPWWSNYMSPQVTGCFDNFYADEALQESFLEGWSLIAEAVCATEEVVGFDALNEPWPGSRFGDPDFDNEVLMPFYSQVMETIEAVCPGRLYFLEPTQLYQLGLAERLAFPPELRDRLVVAPHWYPPSVHEPGDGWMGTAGEIAESLTGFFRPFLDEGTPVWVGEWGGVTSNPSFDVYFDDFTEATLGLFIGSAIWEYSVAATSFSFLDADGTPRAVFASSGRVPIPTILPSPPSLVAPDVIEGGLTVEFECFEGRRLEVLLPEDGPRACTATPEGALSLDEAAPDEQTGRCLADGVVVTLDCW